MRIMQLGLWLSPVGRLSHSDDPVIIAIPCFLRCYCYGLLFPAWRVAAELLRCSNASVLLLVGMTNKCPSSDQSCAAESGSAAADDRACDYPEFAARAVLTPSARRRVRVRPMRSSRS